MRDGVHAGTFHAIAACNLSDQTVIGGRGDDLDRLTEDAHTQFPRKRPTRLKTEGAFHTFYMITAFYFIPSGFYQEWSIFHRFQNKGENIARRQ